MNYKNTKLHSVRLRFSQRSLFYILLTVLLFRGLPSLIAQQARIITLRETIDLTIKNSHTLQAGRATVNEAAALVKQAEENRLPSFGASGSYLRLSNANVDIKKSSNNSGGTTNGTAPKISQAAYGILNASYPIFTGGRLKYGIESARYLQQAAVLDADNDREGVILNSINAFTNLYKAQTAIEVVKENLASSRHRDSTFSRLETNGLLARNDLLKAQLETTDIELSLLDAENNRNLANANMDIMLGLPQTTELIPDFNSIPVPGSLKNVEDYEMLALQNRKDLQSLGFRKKAALTNIKSSRAEAYPNLFLTAGYIAAYVPHVITITNALDFGIGFQYNFASLWRTNTKLLQAKAQQQQLLANEAQLNDVIRLQVYHDYQDYLLNQKKIDVYQNALTQATENFRITKNKYDNSLVTTSDLLEADVALLRSRLNLAMGKADVISAYNKLLQTTGQLTQ
ncbi:MAG: TolC family protein [Ginsengibacter sp.]